MSGTKSTETGIALSGEMSIPSVIQALDAQIKSLGSIETSKFKTSMNLAPFGDLKKVKDVEVLIRAYSLVRGKANAYNEAAKEMGIENAPAFKEDGNSLAQWKEDINLQVQIATHKDRLESLKAMKVKAEQFVSEEDKRKMFFSELMSSPLLGGGAQ